jgi:hypothetical protein
MYIPWDILPEDWEIQDVVVDRQWLFWYRTGDQSPKSRAHFECIGWGNTPQQGIQDAARYMDQRHVDRITEIIKVELMRTYTRPELMPPNST